MSSRPAIRPPPALLVLLACGLQPAASTSEPSSDTSSDATSAAVEPTSAGDTNEPDVPSDTDDTFDSNDTFDSDDTFDSGEPFDTDPFDPAELKPCDLEPTVIDAWTMSHPPGALGLADLDADGDLDLFAAQPSAGQVELALNDGAGQFTAGPAVVTGAPQSDMRVTAGDLDGDDDIDLAVALRDSGEIVVLLGQQGEFLAGPTLTASSPPTSVVAVDIDFDGILDLVSIDAPLGAVSVWPGDGLGGFGPEQYTPMLLGTTRGTIVDADTDTVPDILVVPDDVLQIHRRALTGVWVPGPHLNLWSSGWSQALATNFDDSYPDLVVLRADTSNYSALIFWGAFVEEWQGASAFSTTSPLSGGHFADVTGDGVVELIAATGTANVAVLVGASYYGFVCELVLAAVASVTAPEVLASGDVDGDGRIDIVVGSRADAQVTAIRIE